MLNSDQTRILQDAVAAINRGQMLYEYDGKAGTGKTFLMKEIVKTLGIPMSCVLPMAYTGAAASVLRKKGFPTATTLHRGLYDAVDVPNPNYHKSRIDPQYGIPEESPTILKFVPKKALKGVELIVIDEGYMCPDYMRDVIEKFDIPVIVTGDKHQLPPIKAKPAYLWDDNIPSLKQIMRQEEHNPIVQIANMILDDIPIRPGLYGNRVLVIDDTDLTDDLVINSTMVVCGKNSTRDYWNQRAREILGHTADLPEYGERVICRKNNPYIEVDGISLCNGLIGYCISQPGMEYTTRQSFSMDFLPDIAYSPFRQLKCDYEYFTAPSNVRANYTNYYNTGEKFEFAYCITTHLSQGSEADRGIYIKEYLRRDIQKALDYTAVTRFKNSLVIVLPTYKKYY